MVRVSSSTMARLLSRLSRTKINLNTQFNVPPKLWQRIEEYSAGIADGSVVRSTIETTDLLHDLFRLSQGAQQKALMGSILLDLKEELPIDLHCEYLRSLVIVGQVPEAIRLWKLRRPKSLAERRQWRELGIEIHCRAHRPQVAEKLVNNAEITREVCLHFMNAYAEAKNCDAVQKWCDILISLQPVSYQTNSMLRILISAEMWPIVQRVLPIMNELNHTLDPELSVMCFRAAANFPLPPSAFSSLAALLESDGSLVNVSRFRKSIAPSIDSQLSQCLAAGDTEQAVNHLRGYRQPDFIALAYKILKHSVTNPSLDPTQRTQTVAELFDLVNDQSHLHKSSIHIQFMLTYYDFTGQFPSIWSLMRPTNDLYPYISYANYNKFWRILQQYLRNRENPPLLNLREIVLQTTSKVCLQPVLLRRMVLCLNLVSDLPALTSLLQFAHETSNIQVDASSLFRDVKLRSWQEVSQAFADQHHADYTAILNAGREFRRALQL